MQLRERKKWAFKTDGKIEASPAVYGQLLIAGSYDGKVYALGAKSGAIVWTFDAREPITSGSVVVDSGTVYVIVGAKYLYALDVMNGEVKWKRELGRREHYRYAFGWYLSSKEDIPIEEGYSPSVSAGVIYGAYRLEKWYSNGTKKKWLYLSAFDTQNGQIKWQFEVGEPIQNAPAISGGTVYFGCDDGYLYAVHADSGELKWKYFINSSIHSSPVVANGMLYVGADDGYLYAFASDEVIETYSSLNSLKGLLTKLKGEGIDIPDTIPTAIISAEHHLKFGELNQARNEISTAEGLVSEIMHNYTKQQLDSIKKEYTTLKSKGFNVTDTKQLILQAEDELDKGNYDKAIELTEQAKEELQNIKSSEAERARSMLNEVELEIAKVRFIANVSKLEQDLLLVKDKIKNEDYPSAIALLEGIKQRIHLIQEANNAILTAKTTIDQEKERGFNERSAEILLESAMVLFEKGDYENAKKIAEQAFEIAVDTDQDGISNERDRFPDINNTYLYVAIVMLILSVGTGVVILRKMYRTEKTNTKNRNVHRTFFVEFPEKLLPRYESLEFLGEGGFARVFKARRKKDGKIVAVKIPKTLDPVTGKTFVREISNWLHLKHPNIVELYDVNVIPIPYLEMEYCEGSLAKLGKPMDVEQAAHIVFNIAEGLKYAHSKGIIHRDLKPSNVLLKAGIPKISDWGLSKVMSESRSSTLSSFTPYYAAPEQLSPRCFGHTDGRTDIWQLGVLFYELVTGKLPFEGSDLGEVTFTIINENPVPPSKINPEAKLVEPIIMKMLAKKKEERYQSVEELQRDLAKVLNMTYAEGLKKSRDLKRTVFYIGDLALINLKTGNLGDALKYLLELREYAGKYRDDLDWLIDQVKLAMEEGVKLGEDAVMKADVIVHQIKMGR